MQSGLMFPYFQNLSSSDVQQFADHDFSCPSNNFITCLDNLIQTSTISDYDLGGEGDLFKAPEPIINQQLILNTIIDHMSIISSCTEDTISPQQLQVTDMETLKNEEFLNDVFYECKNLNLLPKESSPATESSPLSEVINFSFPVVNKTDEIPKSMSCDNLNSMDWIQTGRQVKVKSNFLNFSEMDFGMRRAFSEGDIKTLSDANYYPLGGQGQSPLMSEDRLQKLSRYRNKKTKRNFGRKIKYACRKALADTQPRIRGRFAKTDTS